MTTTPQAGAEVVWLTQDDEGNFGVWRDPDNARQQIIQDRAAETPGNYEWVNDADRTHELLLRDDEVTGLTLWMALVADAAQDAQPERDAPRTGLLCRATVMHEEGARHYCTLNTAAHAVHQCGDCGHVWTDSGEEFEVVLAERNQLRLQVAAQPERDNPAPDLWWSFTGGADTCYLNHDDSGSYRECCMRAGLAYALEVRDQQVRTEAQPERDGDVRAVDAKYGTWVDGDDGPEWIPCANGSLRVYGCRCPGCVALGARGAKAV